MDIVFNYLFLGIDWDNLAYSAQDRHKSMLLLTILGGGQGDNQTLNVATSNNKFK
jgi:hypothetical protein